MTGPQHYGAAQRLLTVCAGGDRGSDLDNACTAAAQVHATLALAAATIDAAYGCLSILDGEAWESAMSPP